MSAPLMQRLAFRQLPAHQKRVLLAMANYAHEDGTGCRPAQATLAAWTGLSQDRTKRVMRELRRRGLIAVTRPHAQHRPAEYRLVVRAIEALPSLRGEPQQLDMFSTEMLSDSQFPQENPANDSANLRFPQISTDVNRLFPTARGGVGAPRSVYLDPCTKIFVPSRAREPRRARAR
jgi:predicted Fe-S protein YdhL (DUF1289 family)